MAEVIAKRQFTTTYIALDIAFLAVFALLLLWKKKYATLIVGVAMGILYMLVDYGILELSRYVQSEIPQNLSFNDKALDLRSGA